MKKSKPSKATVPETLFKAVKPKYRYHVVVFFDDVVDGKAGKTEEHVLQEAEDRFADLRVPDLAAVMALIAAFLPYLLAWMKNAEVERIR